jgi:hypothetical protein
MKPKLILCLALVLSGGLFGCASVHKTTQYRCGEHSPVTLGKVIYDFNHDGHDDTLSLIWIGGRHYMDDENWCGEGEKYTGQFIFHVELVNGRTVDTTFESLNVPFDFFFASDKQPWPIFVADYNNDGQPDFNIISYGDCNSSAGCLFTVLPSGKVANLPIEGSDYFNINRDDDAQHSINSLKLTGAGFHYRYYGHLGNPDFDYSFDWDAKKKVFHEHQQKVEKEP